MACVELMAVPVCRNRSSSKWLGLPQHCSSCGDYGALENGLWEQGHSCLHAVPRVSLTLPIPGIQTQVAFLPPFILSAWQQERDWPFPNLHREGC